uniref:Uncharacterized protein n=1 Tax=Anguilla anguilla TaxID=7936 RepID=A0A0E9SH42_ANGAN
MVTSRGLSGILGPMKTFHIGPHHSRPPHPCTITVPMPIGI